MKRLAQLLLLALSLLSVSIQASQLVINNVTIISAERDQPLRNAYVLISNGMIEEVSVRPIDHKNAQTFDGSGLYLTPGLMDSHVHLRTMPGILSNPDIPERLLPLQETFTQNQPKAYLYYGVTELVDLNQSQQSLNSFTDQSVRPDVSFCGAIGVLDGYGTAGRSVEQALSWHNNILFDDEQGFKTPDGIDPTKHSAEALVSKIAQDGARCVKIFFEDGFGLANHWKILTNELVQRIRKEAAKHKLPVVGHANAIDMHRLALDNQVDTIAHGLWNWNELESEPGLPDPIKKIITDIVAQKTVFQATFNVMEGLAGVMTDDVFKDPAYKSVVPTTMRDWYQTADGKWFREELSSEVPELTAEQLAYIFASKNEQNARIVKRLAELGHPLVLASDTPSSPTFAAQPGYSTHRELLAMANAGVPLKALFAAATLNNALAFGLEQTYGTVSPGMKANLLLLKKNPWEDVSAYNAIDRVILKGQVYQREQFAAN